MAFLNRYNKDGVLYRNIIVGLLNLLNNKIVLTQTRDNDTIEDVPVPFLYSLAGDERFLQDFYIPIEEGCDDSTIVEGNYDPIPRGTINMTSVSINSSALTSKYVRGTYNKEEKGTVKAYSSMLDVIPMNLTFDVHMLADSFLDALKLVESVVDAFYKAQVFNVEYQGFRVQCQVGFPNEFGIEKPLDFSYGTDNKINIRFSLQMESYHPIKNAETERFRGNVMNSIGNVLNEDNDPTTMDLNIGLNPPGIIPVE